MRTPKLILPESLWVPNNASASPLAEAVQNPHIHEYAPIRCEARWEGDENALFSLEITQFHQALEWTLQHRGHTYQGALHPHLSPGERAGEIDLNLKSAYPEGRLTLSHYLVNLENYRALTHWEVPTVGQGSVVIALTRGAHGLTRMKFVPFHKEGKLLFVDVAPRQNPLSPV